MNRTPLPKQCPNCESKWVGKSNRFGLQRSPHRSPCRVHCTNCSWNDAPETRRITREQYQYYCRLTRLRYAPHQVFPPQWVQTIDILKEAMYELYPRQVPYWMRQHLECASLVYLRTKTWYFQRFTRSRWEYHSMVADGHVHTPQEYQRIHIEHREYLLNNPPDYEERGG